MILMAFDRAPSTRRFDAQGFLHVDACPISKAQIREYYGREIPGSETLGLDADRIYRMFCSGEELAKGAATFNNLPILSEHIPISADSIPDDLIVGTMGNDCSFDGTYLRGSQTVWKRRSIDGIVSDSKRENSCGYAYTAVMDAGTFEGMQFDGVMLNLVGNHVALVIQGRAGPDVLVGDHLMKNAAALLASASAAGYITPRLAADAKVDLVATFKGVTAKSLAMDGAPLKLAKKVETLVTPHLADGQTFAADELAAIFGTVVTLAADEDETPQLADDEEMVDGKVCKKKPAMDVKPEGITQAALDSAITAAVTAATDKAQADGLAIRTAEKAVFPLVGELPAMDSAAAIYKMGLDHLKVDTTGLPEAAYAATFNAVSKAPKETIAVDHRVTGGASVLSGVVPGLKPMGVI